MKKRVRILLLATFVSVGMQAQYSIGMSGMLNIGSAEMNETGTFMGGGNFIPRELLYKGFAHDTGNYFANITLFSFLELNYRGTLFKRSYMGEKPKFNQQDRSVSAKIRPLKEGKYYPAIALGVNDPFRDKGNNYFGSVYAAATKTLRIGNGHRLALTAGYYHPLKKEKFLNTHDGVCGGVSYTPGFCKQLTLMAEYDSKKMNVGAAAKLWKHVSIHVFTSEFNCLSGGLRYECTLIH